MPAAWSSDHPDVLAWWADLEKRERSYVRLCRKVERETGRRVVLRTGFGDESVMGLSKHRYNEDPPPGWKFGWGDRKHDFFEPRATPRKGVENEAVACAQAAALIKKLNDKRPSPRKECHDRFGTPVFQMFGLSACSPGFALLDGRLWIVFGDHDYEPPKASEMTKFFKAEKLSAYHAACEKKEAG